MQFLGVETNKLQPFCSLVGTYFYLNEDTAHPLLSVLEDGLTIACSEIENLECDLPFRDNGFTRYM